MRRILLLPLAGLVAVAPGPLTAQRSAPRPAARPSAPAVDTTLLGSMQYRLVGPYRGGRSTTIAGVAGQPFLFYMGSTGGGVWKTEDAGQKWTPISDGFFGGSIGAIDVADADPNVIYVGTGSVDIRGNTSTGRGLWKSTDAGRTWRFM
nr:glycosyl hydrolase [Gemmatimonadaceae bacterium]